MLQNSKQLTSTVFKEENWPLDVEVWVRFGDWKKYRVGVIRKTQYGHTFYYTHRHENTSRQMRGDDAPHIRLADGSYWNPYQ